MHSCRGADILVTDAECKRAFSIQVKTKSTQSSWWLLSRDYKRFVSDSHIYIFVTLRDSGIPTEFFIVPSKVVARKGGSKPYGKDKDIWYWLDLTDGKAISGQVGYIQRFIDKKMHVYEVRPRKDNRGFDLISDALPCRLWYDGPNAASNAVGYAKFYS